MRRLSSEIGVIAMSYGFQMKVGGFAGGVMPSPRRGISGPARREPGPTAHLGKVERITQQPLAIPVNGEGIFVLR